MKNKTFFFVAIIGLMAITSSCTRYIYVPTGTGGAPTCTPSGNGNSGYYSDPVYSQNYWPNALDPSEFIYEEIVVSKTGADKGYEYSPSLEGYTNLDPDIFCDKYNKGYRPKSTTLYAWDMATKQFVNVGKLFTFAP